MTTPPASSWLELFDPVGTRADGHSREFRVMQRAGQPFLFLPRSAAAAVRSLGLYPAQSRKARTARMLLGTTLRMGLAPGAGSLVVRISRSDGFARFLARAAGNATEELPQFAVLAGNPHAPGRRFVFLLFNQNHEPVAVVKAGGSEAARRLIAHEGNFLKQQAARFTAGVPQLREQFNSERVAAFALEFVRGRTPSAKWLTRPAGVFHTWVNNQRLVALGELAAWRRLLASGHARPLPAAVTALSDAQVHPTLMHGDFAPWNIRVTKARWVALDWERGEADGIPAWDWFHAVVQPAVLVQHAAPDALISQLERVLDSVEFGRYAKLTRISGRERALALAYVGSCIRVIQQTEGGDRLAALEAAMQARWFPV